MRKKVQSSSSTAREPVEDQNHAVKIDENNTHPTKVDENKPHPVKSDENCTLPIKSDENNVNPVNSDESKPESVKSDEDHNQVEETSPPVEKDQVDNEEHNPLNGDVKENSGDDRTDEDAELPNETENEVQQNHKPPSPSEPPPAESPQTSKENPVEEATTAPDDTEDPKKEGEVGPEGSDGPQEEVTPPETEQVIKDRSPDRVRDYTCQPEDRDPSPDQDGSPPPLQVRVNPIRPPSEKEGDLEEGEIRPTENGTPEEEMENEEDVSMMGTDLSRRDDMPRNLTHDSHDMPRNLTHDGHDMPRNLTHDGHDMPRNLTHDGHDMPRNLAHDMPRHHMDSEAPYAHSQSGMNGLTDMSGTDTDELESHLAAMRQDTQTQAQNLHQSPARPGMSPGHPEGLPPHTYHEPYHPPQDLSVHQEPEPAHSHHLQHLQNLQYSMSSQYPNYNHHYFNNANNYNGQSGGHPYAGMSPGNQGFPLHFSNGMRGMPDQHAMYMNQNRAHQQHESHHSSHVKSEFGHPEEGHPGAMPQGHPQGGRMGDPYSFTEDEMRSPPPGRPMPFNSMGSYSNMQPMPLVAPKPKKPRKPRTPKQLKPELSLPMELKHEDPRSDLSFDDDGDEDGKLVIAEGDDLDMKEEGMDGMTGMFVQKEKKPRRKHNRFNGMSEEEVVKRLLPDLIVPDLDILIVGINPGMYAAYKQHHYAGPGNHFWKCMYLAGLINRPMNADNDQELLNIGIGFTNIVERTTKASGELSRQEIEEGAKKLISKIRDYKPKIAVFNGKGIYEVFSGQKEFIFGKQPDKISETETYAWVMPNSSARCAQLPRAVDKVPFYAALKKFRDYLKGDIDKLEESEVVFPEVKLQNFNQKRPKKDEFRDESKERLEGEPYDDDDMMERIDPLTGKKRRGRPPKPRPDGTLPPPKRRRVDEFGNPLPKGSNPIDPLTGKKKRGRPKKCDMVPMPPMTSISNGLPRHGLEKPDVTESSNDVTNASGNDSDHSTVFSSAGKTPPTRLPPFSPNFARGMVPMGGGGGPPNDFPKEDDSETDGSMTPRPDSVKGGGHSSLDGDDGAKDLSRPDSLPDLSGRLGDEERGQGLSSPPPSPPCHSLPPPEFDPPNSLPEDEASHSIETHRPDSAQQAMAQPCNFSNPNTPVDVHSMQRPPGYPGQPQGFSPYPMNKPHHSPNYPPPGAQNFHAPYRSNQQQMQHTPPHQMQQTPPGMQHTPPHQQIQQTPPHHIQQTPPHQQNYDSPPMGAAPARPKPHDPSDVSAKSLTGLESLVDQIPALAENDSGVYSGSGAGSHPATPRSVGPYSPAGQFPNSAYLPGPPNYSGPQYSSGPPPNTPGSDSFPADLSTSTNYGHSAAATTAPAHSPVTPSNFSVSSLAHSSVRGGGDVGGNGDATITAHNSSDAFSVSSLTSSYAPPTTADGGDMPSKYPGLASPNPYMMSSNHGSMFSPSSLMSRSIGPPNSFMGGSMGSSMAGMGMMGSMAGMSAMYGMSNYGQYSSAAGAYSGAAQAAAASFAAAATGSTYPHGLHMPNPSYPYPSPYSQSPYSQSPYF